MSYRKTYGSVLPVLLLSAGLIACSQPSSQSSTETPVSSAPTAAETSAAAPAEPVADRTSGMDSDALRDAASEALRENRMYAPAGHNAIEYYLALREKMPEDIYVGGALVDLLPYTVTAAENTLSREHFAEAGRLVSLIEKINPKAPALPRLKKGLVDGQALVARRSEAEAAKAKLDTENRLKQQAEQQRLAKQQSAEAEAARQLAAQQEAARQDAARQQAAAQARQQDEQRAAAAAAAAASVPRVAAAPALRAISTPAPRYPPDALRSGTEGEVMMELTVGTDGAVTNARVLRSEPARIFDREALNAVRRWKFEPLDNPTTIRRTVAFKSKE